MQPNQVEKTWPKHTNNEHAQGAEVYLERRRGALLFIFPVVVHGIGTGRYLCGCFWYRP